MLAARARALGLDVPIGGVGDASEAPAVSRRPPRIAADGRWRGQAGHPGQAAVPAIRESIERAVRLVRHGAARAMVTNPISKSVLYGAGFAFPGHTEYLAALAATEGHAPHPVMMLAALR